MRTGTTLTFAVWLKHRCAQMSAAERDECQELVALSLPPSKKVCAFRGMTSFGSHYRVDMEEGGVKHVTFDSGVAELQSRRRGQCTDSDGVRVQLVRVGVLKNILVLCYGNLNIVLMVVSWVAKHTEDRPRLRRDAYGFWLANMAARPRDTTNPYLLPALASQVVCRPGQSSFIIRVHSEYRFTTNDHLTMQAVLCRCFLWRIRPCQDGPWS